jgi:hypothetical protein
MSDDNRAYEKKTNGSTDYQQLLAVACSAPARWSEPCVHTECSLHQLSPYIGKLKSSMRYCQMLCMGI